MSERTVDLAVYKAIEDPGSWVGARHGRTQEQWQTDAVFASLRACGFVVVPLNPTRSTLKIGQRLINQIPSAQDTAADDLYRAMVEAAGLP